MSDGNRLGRAFVAAIIATTAVSLGNAAHAADGAALYQANCATCHGADGAGDTPVGKAMKVPSLKGSERSADAIAKFVKESGKHTGPAGKLSAEELSAVAEAAASL